MSATAATPGTMIRNASYKDKLLEIANEVNAAPGIKDILAIMKDRVPNLVDAERVTVSPSTSRTSSSTH